MNKEILIDVDGVAIAARKKYFSTRLSEEYGVALEDVMPLFKDEFKLCVVGKADLKRVIPKYLEEWGWKGSIDDLLQFWWTGENTPNDGVLAFIDKLRERRISCYLASDQEKHRAQYLMEEVGLEKHFDGAFFSCDLGVSKEERGFWDQVLARLHRTDFSDLMFWDDDEKNVAVACQFGVDGRVYKSFEDFKEQMKGFLQ